MAARFASAYVGGRPAASHGIRTVSNRCYAMRMSTDTKWIIGTIVPAILVVAGLLSAQIAGLNARIDDVNARIGDVNTNVNARVGDVNASTNARFDDVNRRFDDLQDSIRELRAEVRADIRELREIVMNARNEGTDPAD